MLKDIQKIVIDALRPIKKSAQLSIQNAKWRKLNHHNYTVKNSIFNNNFVKVGEGTYGDLNIFSFGSGGKVVIGNYCSIAKEVIILSGGEHDYNSEVLYHSPISKNVINYSKGEVIIEDDVWIGYGTKILSGVRIGRGSVIGAFSVVTKDVPPFSIAFGCPAKVKKYRFTDEKIQALQKLSTIEFLQYVKSNLHN